MCENERGFDLLEAAMDRRELSAVWIRTDPRLDRLRDTPRFMRLMDRLNAYAHAGAIQQAAG